MKNLLVFLVLPIILLMFFGESYARPENVGPLITVEGYWKLASVDIKKRPNSLSETTTLFNGGGSYSVTYPTPRGNGAFGTSYSWTLPKDRYRAGESVNLTLSIKIVDYAWYSEQPNDLSDMIIAGFEEGELLRDADDRAEARVSSFKGDILDRSEARSVSGKFPPGTPGARRILYVYCDGAGVASYNYEWVELTLERPAAEPRVVREGSYWELTSVDVQKCPDNSGEQYTLTRGSGTYRRFDNDEEFRLSFSFTEPEQLIYAGQTVKISVSINIDDYKWNGQFNNMGGTIEAGFLPGLPFKKSDNPNIWFAGVSGVNGKYVKRNDTVVLSGKFPPPTKNGKATLYVKTNHCATILYHYKCIYVD